MVGVNHTYETAVTVFPDGEVVALDPDALGGALGPNAGDYERVFAARGAVCEYKAADLGSVVDQLEHLDRLPVGLGTDRLDLTAPRRGWGTPWAGTRRWSGAAPTLDAGPP